MFDVVQEKDVGAGDETQQFVEVTGIELRLDGDVVGMETVTGYADALAHQLGAQTLTATEREHAAQRTVGEGDTLGQHTQIGSDALVIVQPEVIGILVPVVQVLIGAILLQDKDGIARLEQGIEFIDGKFRIMFYSQLHRKIFFKGE